MNELETFELYAIRYAHHGGRNASEMFIGGDPHEPFAVLENVIH